MSRGRQHLQALPVRLPISGCLAQRAGVARHLTVGLLKTVAALWVGAHSARGLQRQRRVEIRKDTDIGTRGQGKYTLKDGWLGGIVQGKYQREGQSALMA